MEIAQWLVRTRVITLMPTIFNHPLGSALDPRPIAFVQMSDLFASGSAARRQLRRFRDRGARGPRTRSPPARHVYRRDRRARAPSPRRRGHRQSMDEAVAGHATRIEVTLDTGNRLTVGRQWPRHPGRSAPQISGQVGARGHPDHASFGRQVRGQGLFHLGRPARRRRKRRQCAVDRNDRRGCAREEALSPDLLEGRRRLGRLRRSARRRTAAGRPSASFPIPRFSAPTPGSAPSGFTSWPGRRPICSPGSKSAGAATRRSLARTSPRTPSSSSPAASPTI